MTVEVTRPISVFLDSFIGRILTDVYAVYRFITDENERMNDRCAGLVYR